MQLNEARIYGLLGKNGTGKSTLLYLIAGLLRPQEGRVTIDGNDAMQRSTEMLQELFIVPEEFVLPDITLDEYVRLNAPFYPHFSREVLARCLDSFELSSALHLHALSMGEKKKVTVMRAFIVFFIVVSAYIAIIKDSHPEITFIAQMMGVSWGALAGSFLAPFLYGLYWKGTSRAACYVTFAWGCGLMIIQMWISLGGVDISGWAPLCRYMFASSIRSGVLAMVGGLVIVPVVSMFTRKQDRVQLDKLFSCYEEKVTVSKKEALD